jgi:hypothetical protein
MWYVCIDARRLGCWCTSTVDAKQYPASHLNSCVFEITLHVNTCKPFPVFNSTTVALLQSVPFRQTDSQGISYCHFARHRCLQGVLTVDCGFSILSMFRTDKGQLRHRECVLALGRSCAQVDNNDDRSRIQPLLKRIGAPFDSS